MWLIAVSVAALIGCATLLQWIAVPRDTRIETSSAGTQVRRLVVMAHGLSGRESFDAAVELAREALPDSDFVVFDVDSRVLSNQDPYRIAETMETAVNERVRSGNYDDVVLVGHSMGGLLLRKALLWANGLERDRDAPRGLRPWARKVSRFVSLASINRGWSIDPPPSNMKVGRQISIVVGQRIARWTGTGRLLLGLQRGAPFVADSRVQWIDLAHGKAPDGARLPQTIHLLGDIDDIVNQDDAADFAASPKSVFVSLTNTDHAAIASALHGDTSPAGRERRRKVSAALQGRIDELDPTRPRIAEPDPTVRRLAYVVHGIRDYGEWGESIASELRAEAERGGERMVVVNPRYGHFAMAPFLLYWDRQRNVRWFMDVFTENLARYPNLESVDFVGHSNGTYILGSALQKYRSLQFRRVYFAGSVVPKHYPWRPLLDEGRLGQVANVAASGDWVVALFPRLFEQVAEWQGLRPVTGLLDVGSAGFRGFEDLDRRVNNFQFARGGHSVAIAPGDDGRQQAVAAAIARYVVNGDSAPLAMFREDKLPSGKLAFFSNICWLVWLGLAALLGVGAWLTFRWRRLVGTAYLLVVAGLLYSV
jgi:pimeloyl-ACP methyl ester carboxylesterase